MMRRYWFPLSVAAALLAFALLAGAGCAAPPDTSDPCYSPEHGRVLPPIYGTDC
jgi:hypothetical protein